MCSFCKYRNQGKEDLVISEANKRGMCHLSEPPLHSAAGVWDTHPKKVLSWTEPHPHTNHPPLGMEDGTSVWGKMMAYF